MARLGLDGVLRAFFGAALLAAAASCSSAAGTNDLDASPDGAPSGHDAHQRGKSDSGSNHKGQPDAHTSNHDAHTGHDGHVSGPDGHTGKDVTSPVDSHAKPDGPGHRDGSAKHDGQTGRDAESDAKTGHDAKTESDAKTGHDAHGQDGGHDAHTGDDSGHDAAKQTDASDATSFAACDGGCGTGTACVDGSACASLVCFTGAATSPHGAPVNCPAGESCTCQAATFTDGVKNDSETDIDCGGSSSPNTDGAPACGDGKACGVPSDCTSDVCQAGKCVAATCNDGMKDGQETGTDCGGPSCNPCPTGQGCLVGTDCQNDVCFNAVITPATASTNGDPINCPAGQTCTCQAPIDTDGVENDSETGIDCGGSTSPTTDGAPQCAAGSGCEVGTDCVSLVCFTGAATSHNGQPVNCPHGKTCTCQEATDTDGVQNDSETGIDCGGSTSPTTDGAGPCGTGQGCVFGTDCLSLACGTGPVDSSNGQPVDCPAGQTCTCQGATPSDGIQNDSETDVDCGGGYLASGAVNHASDGALACVNGDTCNLGTDCQSLVCFTGIIGPGTASVDGSPINCPAGQTCTCQAATDMDGVANDSETAVDCGGSNSPTTDGAPACATGQACLVGTDCQNLVCYFTAITPASASTTGAPIDCPVGQTCTCQPPEPNDGVQNDSETGIDCGGGTSATTDGAPACGTGQGCVLGTDCQNFICYTGATTSPDGQPVDCPATGCTCQAPTFTDGVQNDSETGIDCGGGASATTDGAPGCPDDGTCLVGTDCLSGWCTGYNGAGNGGTCVGGQSCTAPALASVAAIMDLTGNVDANGDAIGTPDTNGAGQHAGLDTCGIGEATDPTNVQNHEDCCRSLEIPPALVPAGDAPGTRLDKYEVTAGRMRQFIEYVNATEVAVTGYPYDLQDFMTAQFDGNWNPVTPIGTRFAAQIPSQVSIQTIIQLLPLLPYSNPNEDGNIAPFNNDSIVAILGGTTMDPDYPSTSQGCYTGGPGESANGAATYWWPAVSNYDVTPVVIGLDTVQPYPINPRPFTQDYYDIKSINCTPFYVYAAFCAWDGGHVATLAELDAVYGGQQYPWDPPGVNTPLPANYPYTTSGGYNFQTFVPGTQYYSGPNGGLAGQPGYNAVDLTMNWNNDSFGENSGDFYYYPNGGNGGPGTAYGFATNPPSSISGLDFSPFIASPGRFYLDATYITSPSGSGLACGVGVACPAGESCINSTCVTMWQDLGANMLEMSSTWVAQGDGAAFCDCSYGGQASPDPSGDCSFICPNSTPPVYASLHAGATNLPYIQWEGGSWEGHETANPASAPFFSANVYEEVFQTQYGKAGVRCARDPE